MAEAQGAPEPGAGDVININTAAAKRKEAPKQPTADQEGAKILRFRVERGGSSEGIGLTTETRAALSQRVRDRYEVAKDLDQDPSKPRLNEYDRLLLAGGESFADKIASGEALTQQELAIASAVVADELRQKASTTRINAEDQSGRFTRVRELLGERRVVGGIVRRFAQPDRLTVSPADGPHFSSAYLDKLGYEDWDAARRGDDLVALNDLRERINSDLGRSVEGVVPGFDGKNGDRLHDASEEAAERIITREFPQYAGMSLIELQDQDPMRAEMIRQRAMQEGLMEYARDEAKALLKTEKPTVDTVSIKAHIDQLGKKATNSELERLRDTRTESEEKFSEAKEHYQELRSELKNAHAEVAKAKLDLQQAQAAREAQNPTLPGGARQFDQQIMNLQKDIRTYEGEIRGLNTALPAGMTADAAERLKAHYAQLIDSSRGRMTEFITKKGQLDDAVSNADARNKYYDARIKAIDGKAGELAKARKDQDKARKEHDKAKSNVTEGEEGVTPTKGKRKEALQAWQKVGEGYDKIIDERFGQKREDRLTAAKLGSAAEIDGEIVGGDRIREHLFRVADPEWWAKEGNKELARRMLSDEAIAKGIIETFRIDTGNFRINVAGVGPISYEDCFNEIDARRKDLDDAMDKLTEGKAKGAKGAALTALETAVTNARNNIREVEQPMLKAVLPYLQNANEFQIGDTMRYLVRHGLEAAANGAAYYNGEAFEKPEAEMRIEAESILEEHKGKVRFIETNMAGMGEAPRVQWEGDLSHVQDDAFGFPVDNQNLDLTFRVTQNLDRYNVRANVDVLVNEQFLQALPETLAGLPNPDAVPDAIRNLLYDGAGNLRTELRLRDRTSLERLMASRRRDIDNRGRMWLTVREGIERPAADAPTPADSMLNALDTELAPDAGIDFAVATANTVLTMTPNERLNVVKGFHNLDIPSFTLLGETPPRNIGVTIDFDNSGRFWVTETAGGMRVGERRELENFYGMQEDAYRRRLGVQNLDPEQRRDLQAEYIAIQEEIGKQILLLQQQR